MVLQFNWTTKAKVQPNYLRDFRYDKRPNIFKIIAGIKNITFYTPKTDSLSSKEYKLNEIYAC